MANTGWNFFEPRAITTPEAAARQRVIADALQVQNANPSNWAEGLSAAIGGFTGNVLNNRAMEAEEAGRASAGEALAGLGPNASFEQISAALSNPWLSPAQSNIGASLMQQNMKLNDPLYQAQVANELASGGGGQESFFGTAQPIRLPDGTITYGQFGNQGGFNIPNLPDGAQFLTPVQQLNTGTGFTGVDRFGNPTGEVTPIDSFTPAQDAAMGTAIGEAAAAKILGLPQTIATSNNMVATIDGVLNDPALDESTGWLSWMQAVPGTDQYRFGQRALQLQGQAFLQAFESLKGGGAITETEGQKATQAIGRLSTAQNPADYRAALNELKSVIEASKQRAVDSAGSVQLPGTAAIGALPAVSQPAQPAIGADPLGLR